MEIAVVARGLEVGDSSTDRVFSFVATSLGSQVAGQEVGVHGGSQHPCAVRRLQCRRAARRLQDRVTVIWMRPSPFPASGLFIGKVPLSTHARSGMTNAMSGDYIADAFKNSSRKTLSYVALVIQNDEVVVRSTLAMSRDGAHRWASTAVGYFLGRKPYFHHLNEYARSSCPAVLDITATAHGFYFFRHKHTQVPVWIRLRHLSVEFWTNDGLSTVASGIGRPLYQDAIMKACTRLDFARVYVMLDISSTLPKHIVVIVPKEDGGETPCRIDVEYEWLPPKCTACKTLRHRTKDSLAGSGVCSQQYAFLSPNRGPPRITWPRTKTDLRLLRLCLNRLLRQPRRVLTAASPPLMPIINAVVWNVRGLNRRDHQVVVSDLISEFHVGLLETRVSVRNVARHDEVDVTVISVYSQMIHCSVLIRHLHISVLVSMIYGTNDGVERRQLWDSLVQLVDSIDDEPWLVMGDFNTVADMSEVCGYSGDIRVAMEEFQDCISQTGLITLPMQGDLFTWHNRSTDSRSLWKRLDRMLANDRWLARWPDFIPTVQRIWGNSVVGTAMYSVTRKLKALKPLFRAQRKQKGDLSRWSISKQFYLNNKCYSRGEVAVAERRRLLHEVFLSPSGYPASTNEGFSD
ncbi:UNVERIFIED_CONTAM: hypothetical protein Slati_1098500 [Sesamum latifolium]|uniref:Endonuclease/exonuclease/phosphatase domain-containing protein n=1 Tax=Sesamum latifolium TaxID=2727402 RepID=A0AAW2XAW1_9LAMI